MALKISNEIKTALLAIIALVIFVIGYNYLRGSGAFNKNKMLFATLDNANGLTPSSFVLLHGVNIGSVKNIYLSKKEIGKVEIEFSVSNDAPVPADSKALVTSIDLFGNKAITIVPGTAANAIADKAYINSEIELGMMDKLGENAGPIMKNIDGTVLQAKAALTTVDNTVANINSLIDANTKANLQNSISGLNASVKDFNLLSASLAAQRQKIASTVGSLETFANNLNKNNEAINASLANVKTTTDNLSKADISTTINNLKATIASLDKTLGKINDNQGTLGMLVNDKKLYNDLQGSVHSLDALLADLKAHPNRYLSFSVFGRKPKAETAAPAVTPQ
jgi:phospholipid/cholesterol/gamma-HCH transport system substrate-binding protein